MTLDRHTASQTLATSRGFWLSACLCLAFSVSACVGPDLEPPGGPSSSTPATAPGRPADEPATAGTHAGTPETSAAAGKGGPTSGVDNTTAVTPPKMAAAGTGGSSSTGVRTGAGEDAGVEDASVDASSSP